MEVFKIGIIGKGFVGSAVAAGFSASTGFESEIRVYDIDPRKSIDSLEDTVNKSEFLFVSVPTPASVDGSINLEPLKQCLASIDSVLDKEISPIVLIRSTIIPGSSQSFQETFPKLRIVFNPEFLTERNALFDFISQQRFILGGNEADVARVKDLLIARFGITTNIIQTSFETAELIKYMCNTFFATKVSFMNEMYLISEKINADWELVREGFLRDGRVGVSHTNVPGHDGKLGFGGHCFPKDIQALIKFSESIGVDSNTLKGAWKTNLFVRPEKDWEK